MVDVCFVKMKYCSEIFVIAKLLNVTNPTCMACNKILILIFHVAADKGRLMARYCVAFESMKIFLGFSGHECLADMVSSMLWCRWHFK